MKHEEKIKRNIRGLSYLPKEDGERLEEGNHSRIPRIAKLLCLLWHLCVPAL